MKIATKWKIQIDNHLQRFRVRRFSLWPEIGFEQLSSTGFTTSEDGPVFESIVAANDAILKHERIYSGWTSL